MTSLLSFIIIKLLLSNYPSQPKVDYKNYLILFFLVFCFQFTDLKIGLVKISEIILLLLSPIYLFKKTQKFVFYYFILFSILLLISFGITYFLEFEILEPSLLKKPYLISFGRYLEIISCLVLSGLTFYFFFEKFKKAQFQRYVSLFIHLNLILVILFVVIYSLVYFNVISKTETRIVYGYGLPRLRGYFVEGGPFGLMLSAIFMLTIYLNNSYKKFLIRTFLFLVVFFMAQSKAGILCIVIWLLLENLEFLINKIRTFIIPLVVGSGILFCVLFYFLANMYFIELDEIRQSVRERPYDTNITMGRIPAVFIVPEMVSKSPLLGIGIGNYPLLRNNNEYRDFFPIPKREFRNKDAHGFGGIIDLLVDTGLLGLAMFIFIFLNIHYELQHTTQEKKLILGFICLFLFGVQIYFLYPWLLLGIILTKTGKIS